MSNSVVHVITGINRGGAENHLIDLVTRLVQAGVKVPAVFYLKGDGYWTNAFERLGVKAVRLPFSAYGDPRPVVALRQSILDLKPDIVHAHMPPAELYARASIAGLPHVNFVVSKHNDSPFHEHILNRSMERWCARRAAAVICISKAVGAYFNARWSVEPALPRKINVVHYGLDPTPFSSVTPAEAAAVRAGWGIAPEQIAVGLVGRFVPQKAHHTAISAFAKVVADDPGKRFKMVFVGAGPLKDDMQRQIASLGLEDRVVFAGFRTDMPNVFGAFDIFLHSSVHEGFGLVLLEAMCASKPIVATGVSAIPEIVVDGATGHVVPVGDADGLADRMLALRDEGKRRRMGQAGLARARTEFLPELTGEKTRAIYRAVLGASTQDMAAAAAH
jgi:glycosyltransferase involved in cell wall biosynthesis